MTLGSGSEMGAGPASPEGMGDYEAHVVEPVEASSSMGIAAAATLAAGAIAANPTLARRALIGGTLAAGAAAMIPDEAVAQIKDVDSPQYIAKMKAVMQEWFNRKVNLDRFKQKAIGFQVRLDKGEKITDAQWEKEGTETIPKEALPKELMAAKAVVKKVPDHQGSPAYRVSFYITEKSALPGQAPDVDCGVSPMIVLSKKK